MAGNHVLVGVFALVLAKALAWAQPASGGAVAGPAAPPAQVTRIKVQPDKAPDCSSLKSIAESVTRGCKTDDAKAIAIYNFMLLTHYHNLAAIEDGGVPAIKEINVYGWGICGDTHAVMSALWRQLGWGWRFVLWPGHTTVEARHDGRWHYLDAFLKWYLWMPDGKGGRTVAGEEDIVRNRKALWDDAFVLDARRGVGYMKSDQLVMVNGKANWRARDFMDCDYVWMLKKDGKGNYKGEVPRQLNKVGPAESWNGYDHADGHYTTDVNLAPGLALTNTWDPLPDAWYWKGSKKPPAHSCGGCVDTRNSPGLGLVLEPYVNARQPARSYGNGLLTFAPDFTSDACLKSFLSTENVKVADRALVPAEAGKPAAVVVLLSSPYIITKASGEAAGVDKAEVSVDDGKTFTAKDLPATFEIDCPTPRGQYPVYPRMMFLRREVLAPGQQPLPLPQGVVEAKPAVADELQTRPNPILLGTEPPPAAGGTSAAHHTK